MDAGFVAHSATMRGRDSCSPASRCPITWVGHPGTYGGLGATLRHLVEAEERYVSRLEGGTERPGPAPNEPDPPMPPEALAPSVRVLRRRAAASGASLIELAASCEPEAILHTTFRGVPVVLAAVVIFAQALDHGCEHRTQVRHSL
jgi:hypothetical protein